MTIIDDAKHNAKAAQGILANLVHTGPDRRTVLDRIRDAHAGQPGAARWDHAGSAAVVWCFTHETDHQGEPEGCPLLESIVERSDPVGNAATRPDPAARDYRKLNELTRRVRRDLDELVHLLAAHQYREPTELERAQTRNPNDPHCESCARVDIAKGVPWWVEPMLNGSGAAFRTTAADRLPRPLWLCAWCYGHVMTRGCTPHVDELEQRRAGNRVRCPHPELPAEAAS